MESKKKIYVRKRKLSESATAKQVNEGYGDSALEYVVNRLKGINENLQDISDEMKKQTAIQQKFLQVFVTYAKKELEAAAKQEYENAMGGIKSGERQNQKPEEKKYTGGLDF